MKLIQQLSKDMGKQIEKQNLKNLNTQKKVRLDKRLQRMGQLGSLVK
jgi:hypothetical protein